ncbi:MAG: type II secretion system minor pseudopilin GspH [Succinivibrionaceae bacterium]|nr:type II secretion system minor pseudopilin GspH [Succinivibrionaceae bacterium]
MRKAGRGFTLLEILIVIVIMGMAASVVMINSPSSSPESQLHDQCSRYSRLFAFLNEQSMVEGVLIGLYVDEEGMKILRRERSDEADQGMVDSDYISRLIAKYDSYEKYGWVEYKLPQIDSSYSFAEEYAIELAVSGLSYQGQRTAGEDAVLTKATIDHKFDTKVQPQVYFYPSMEVTPFELKISTKASRDYSEYIIKVSENGKVILKNGENDKDPEYF